MLDVMDNKELIEKQYKKMTETPILKLLVSLAIPTIISMLVTSLYSMADTAFVGKLGTSASGATGVVFGFMSILQATGFFFGQGCGSILSRELGAGKVEYASETASTGFFLALFSSIIVVTLSFLNLDRLIEILGSTPTIAPYAKTYISYILVAAPFIVTSFTLNNILRYEGKAKLGAIGMMVGALLNIAGDPILMYGCGMGIAGAGLATATSQIIGFCILLSMFLRGKTQTHLSIKLFTRRLGKIADIAGTGLPSLLRQSLGSISVIILNYFAKVYGDQAIAAMSIVSRTSFVVFALALGTGQGFQPISSFNYGARKYNRVREAYKVTCIVASIIITVLSIGAYILAPDIIKMLRDDPEVIEIGVRALRLQLIAQLVLPMCMVTEMLLQTTGNKASASLLSSCRSGFIFIPLLIVMSLTRGLAGIQEAQPLAYILNLIPSIYFAKRFFCKLREME